MKSPQVPDLRIRLLASMILAAILGACSPTVTPLSFGTSVTDPPGKPTIAQATATAASAALEDGRDDARAATSIRQIMGHPAGTVSFIERAIMINSPDADICVLNYEDQNGARYSVDESQYVLVQYQPSGLRFAPGATLSAETLHEEALALASLSVGFDQLLDRLRYEEGEKGDNHFFIWTDTKPGWKYNPPTLQVALGGDGTLVSYLDTLPYVR